jgi:thiamine phosphate synthase YjbQ (UPF0047 family)
VDITDEVQKSLESTSLKAGAIVIFVPGATGAVTTIEYEDGLVADLGDALERIAPQEIVLLELDNRKRHRKLVLQMMGE